jgi:Ca2+-binding EF-hand superfamily protein
MTLRQHLMSLDNEFTQLMKGLQGERLRQAFAYLDKDQDGFIKPEEFKRIILVRQLDNWDGGVD